MYSAHFSSTVSFNMYTIFAVMFSDSKFPMPGMLTQLYIAITWFVDGAFGGMVYCQDARSNMISMHFYVEMLLYIDKIATEFKCTFAGSKV